jgi:hypothetical protein
MSLNDRARSRSRWPSQFDVEGVPRDNQIRSQKIEAQMQIAGISTVGVFDFNNPPQKPYVFQEFPKVLYRAAEKRTVKDKAAEVAAIEEGWTLRPGVEAKPAKKAKA